MRPEAKNGEAANVAASKSGVGQIISWPAMRPNDYSANIVEKRVLGEGSAWARKPRKSRDAGLQRIQTEDDQGRRLTVRKETR